MKKTRTGSCRKEGRKGQSEDHSPIASRRGEEGRAYSGEFKFSPSVVRSVPSASVLRSGSVMRMTLSNPSKPNRSGTGGVYSFFERAIRSKGKEGVRCLAQGVPWAEASGDGA